MAHPSSPSYPIIGEPGLRKCPGILCAWLLGLVDPLCVCLLLWQGRPPSALHVWREVLWDLAQTLWSRRCCIGVESVFSLPF